MSYRNYEDRHKLIKYFGNKDIEYEVVLSGLASLKGSSKWGVRAKELEHSFIKAFDGLDVPTIELKKTDTDSLINQYLDRDPYFQECDVLTFRKAHDECIKFFAEVSLAFSLLVKDDHRK